LGLLFKFAGLFLQNNLASLAQSIPICKDCSTSTILYSENYSCYAMCL